jgi:hypothetical protein
MKIYDGSKKELMNVRKLEQDGNDLVIKGKIFGAMPMSARLTPKEARQIFKLLSPSLVWFLLTFLFRKSEDL